MTDVERFRTVGPAEHVGTSYRADLDGMRAVAVIAVVIYHLDPAWLPGGFTGVDVFFVLSGFFITQLLARSLDDGRFDLLDFYDRRIRRLLPALIVMLAVSSVAASILLMPEQFALYGKHLLAAILSFSNVVFWLDSGYFAPDAETFPLLHTWSLAVEEQFYLVFPPLLWAVWRWRRAFVLPFVFVMTGASFVVSAWLVTAHPSAAFFLAPARVWELGLGGLLALGAVRAPRSGLERQAGYGLGLALVAVGFEVLSPDVPFPGPAALLPCVGTALVVWAGLGMRAPVGIGRWLAVRPMVGVGLLSYSLYLWHWPMIVFAREAHIGPMPAWMILSLLLPIVAVSYLSWRFVETPFRKGEKLLPRRRERWMTAGAAALALCSLGHNANALEGYPGRLSPDAASLAAAEQDKSPERPRCHAKGHGQESFRDMCRFGPRRGPAVIMFADSHGTELSYAFGQRADHLGIRFTQITGSACPPAVGYNVSNRPNCERHTNRMLKALKRRTPATIIMAVNYELWQGFPNRETFWTGLDETLGVLSEAGHRVILLGPIPTSPDGVVPVALAKWAQLGRDPRDYRFDVSPLVRDVLVPRVEALVDKHGVEYVPMLPVLCGSDIDCPGLVDGHVIYYDDDHLSVSMAGQVVDQVLAPMVTAEPIEGR